TSFGVEYVMMVNVDNAPLVGPRAMGYHILSGENIEPGIEHMSMLVVEKTDPQENVGMAVLLNNENGIISLGQIINTDFSVAFVAQVSNLAS
ncbi:MAG: hypothetical protein AAB116_21015, partial [Candidatus Poribacteria bacterium]